MMKAIGYLCGGILFAVVACHRSKALEVPLINGDFEIDTPVVSPPTGWTTSAGAMFVTSGSGLSPIDPTSAYSGNNFLSANRLAPNPDVNYPSIQQAMSIYQLVDVSSYSSLIDQGNRFAQLSFAYSDNDPGDNGRVAMRFLDSSLQQLGSELTFQTDSKPTALAGWDTSALFGSVPAGTRGILFTLTGESVGTGSARNISFDALTAELSDSAPPRDTVHGNLIMFNENGGWSWYQDERSVIDPTNQSLVIGSVANYMGAGGEPRDGDIDITSFNLGNADRTRTTLSKIPTLSKGDDHNVSSIWQRADGRFVAMYTGHLYGSGINGTPNGSDSSPKSFYRVSTNPNDASSWQAEKTFTWPENDTTSPINNDVTYSNLLFMEDEGTGEGRLYNMARAADRTMNFSYSDDQGETWTYGGKISLTDSSAQQSQYSNGYFKFSSNGSDRIDFIATEHHPRDFNTSIYHGYIQNGKSYDASGNVIDENIFDEVAPPPAEFSAVWTAQQVANNTYHHGWTAELERDEHGNLYGLFTARYGTEVADNLTGDGDHRLFYAKFDATTSSWSTTELGKMGPPLHSGEQDYTGIGTIHPNDPSTIYISTNFDPRDDSQLNKHEIFKGITQDHGSTWHWAAVTENSTYDNLRPIIPSWDANNTAVLWLRGNYPWQRDYDLSVVGLIDRNGESVGLINYIDASISNTTLSNGSPFPFSGPSSTAGAADGIWHQRTGVGNNGSVLAADESGAENVPTLKTTVTDLADGTYDVFVFFWADINQDWQIRAGLSENDLMLFRMQASQQTEADQFDSEVAVDLGDKSLYRAYVGRIGMANQQPLEIFINDADGNGNQSVWYDGVGISKVTSNVILGDFDVDGDVDGRDLLEWQRGNSNVPFSAADLADWQLNYGYNSGLSASEALAVPEVSTLSSFVVGLFLLFAFPR
jgi:hypothetical protein